MAQGNPQLKFERNLCIKHVKFRDNCDTDGRWMDGRTADKFRFHELC